MTNDYLKLIFTITFLFSSTLFWAQSDNSINTRYTAKQRTYYYRLNKTLIPVKIFIYGGKKDIVVIKLHDDETTSIDAAKSVLEQTGGLLIEIENNDKRLISFPEGNKIYRFDPNRMFSKKGIIISLKRLNGSYSKAVLKKVYRFGYYILKKVPSKTATLIAVHNNEDGKLTIYSYGKGGNYQTDALKMKIVKARDPDNFFLTTDSKIFKQLKSANYNVVLQNNKMANDDGSLSIIYGHKQKSYVNVEAQKADLEEQVEMIKKILSVISSIKSY